MSLITNPPHYNKPLNYLLVFLSVFLRISSLTVFFFSILSFYYDPSHTSAPYEEECQLLSAVLQGTVYTMLFTIITTGSPVDLFFAHYHHESHKAFDVFMNTMTALFGTVWAVNEHKCAYLFSENLRLRDHWVFLYIQFVHIMPVYVYLALLILTNLVRFPFQPMSFHLTLSQEGFPTALSSSSSPIQMPPLPKLRQFTTTQPPDCSICYEPIADHSLIRDIPCGHVYHQKCLDTWLLMSPHNGCPICRINVRVLDP